MPAYVKKSIVFNGKVLFSVAAIAEMTGYSPFRIRILAAEGKIPAIKVGSRYWWFDKNSVLLALRSEGKGTLSVENYEKARLRALVDDL